MENQAINVTGNFLINLKGIGLGDPLVNFRYQGIQYSNVSYNIGLVNKAQQIQVEEVQNQGMQYLDNNQYADAWDSFTSIIGLLQNLSGGNSVYDVRIYNDTSNDNYAIDFLNNQTIKALLHTPEFEYSDFNSTVGDNYGPDFAVGVSNLMPFILNNIKVLIFSGQDDCVINIEGVEDLLRNIQWSSMERFLRSRKFVWKVEDKISGYAMSYGNLNFVFVLKSGHIVLEYQPAPALDMLIRFIENKGWD